jgi:putative transcriptional regulator
MSVPTKIKPATAMARIVWKMRQVMADRKITNRSLAESLDKHPTGISRLKGQDELPAIGSEEIERIRVAISKLSSSDYGECKLSELVQIEEDLVSA